MPASSLSVVIITFNEEQNIARCLTSLLKIADEIIVMDSRSQDKTEEICNSFGVRFVSTDWKGYAATKNEAISYVNNEYVLSIDADECLDENITKEIADLKEIGFQGVYSLNRLTNYCGKWIYFSGWNPDWKVRIFPRTKVKWNNELVHEELIIPAELKATKLQGRLHHYSYNSLQEHRQKADKYSLMTAVKYAGQGKKASIFSPLVSAIARFVTMYIFKLGFLDGKAGFNIAYISATSNALKYSELRRLSKKQL